MYLAVGKATQKDCQLAALYRRLVPKKCSYDERRHGTCVEGWANADFLGLMQQLGAIPQIAQTGA